MSTTPAHYPFDYPTHMFDRDIVDPTALRSPSRRPVAAFKCWLFCGFLTFVPHEYNSSTRKIVTIIVFLVWGIIEIAIGAGTFSQTGLLTYLRPLVFLILGQMWGIEIVNMQAFSESLQKPPEKTDQKK